MGNILKTEHCDDVPSRIILLDMADRTKVEITTGYGGVLFTSNFILSYKDAKKLAVYINRIVRRDAREKRLARKDPDKGGGSDV